MTITTKPATDQYRDGFDAIFGAKKEVESQPAKPFPQVRECCWTFKGSPHHKTCEKWKGKK